MPLWEPVPGETPIEDATGLLVPGNSFRHQLNEAESANIDEAVLKYLIGTPSRREAPFDIHWAL
jgi:hypothetical protein